MSTVPKYSLSPAQYLAQERRAEFKSQYFRGEVFAMAGASREHNLIVGNLVREIGNALKDRPCEVYPSDMRVKVAATGLYTYPDATVVCGDPVFEDDHFDTLINPTVVFEVLSESTESWDRGGKFRQYRDIPALQEYAMVTQDRPGVERYIRQQDGGWLLQETQSIEASVRFESIDVTVPLSEIYRNVRFEDPANPEETPTAN
ncbi:MAG: Uma2 family endonuclease [Planctomycetaceae bacterium]